VHVVDNSNNEIEVVEKKDVGGDEKQVIKFDWPYYDYE